MRLGDQIHAVAVLTLTEKILVPTELNKEGGRTSETVHTLSIESRSLGYRVHSAIATRTAPVCVAMETDGASPPPSY